MLRTQGHGDISITHLSFDRGVHMPVTTLFKQRMAAFYTPDIGPDLGPEAEIKALMDWLIACPCALHDAHNGLKW
eukprot:6269610-Lingulodinium_polyedra.AAC.1